MIRPTRVVSLLESLYTAGAPTTAAWASRAVGEFAALAPSTVQLSLLAYDHRRKQVLLLAFSDPATEAPYRSALEPALHDMSDALYAHLFRPPHPVWLLSAAQEDYQRRLQSAAPVDDVLGIIVEPEPYTVASASLLFRGELQLGRHEHALLTRVALHLEAATRVRLRPEAVVGYVTSQGRVELATSTRAESAAVGAAVGAAARAIDASRTRSKRADGETALEVWQALIAGRYALAERVESDGKRVYALYENLPRHRALRALTERESFVVHECARGLSNKEVGYALGLSPPAVSTALASAAQKLGVLDARALVRLAAALRGAGGDATVLDALTRAEREVALAVLRGLSNEQIARERGSSVYTVANQVGAVLRKTGATSRRELVVRAGAAAEP